MADTLIDAIRAAEEQAAAIRDMARKDAAEIVKQASKDAAALVDKAFDDAKADAVKIVGDAKATAEDRAREDSRLFESRSAAIREKADGALDKAAALILKELTGS